LVAFVADIPIYLFLNVVPCVEQFALFALVATQQRGCPAWIIGTFERALAFGLFYRGVREAYMILGGWIGAKLAVNWQRRSIAGSQKRP